MESKFGVRIRSSISGNYRLEIKDQPQLKDLVIGILMQEQILQTEDQF